MYYEEINIRHGDVEATVAPARGALVSALKVGSKQLLYLDRSTFEDETKNVRGGIPVLFPYAGKLESGKLKITGTEMGQHGFGRNRSWQLKEQKPWFLRMALVPEEADRKAYPFKFLAEQSCTILPRGLQVELCIVNTGDKVMPVSPGWHPYFSCPASEKSKLKVEVAAVDHKQFTNDREFDFGVVAPADGRVKFEVPGVEALALSFAPEMRHLQFWSQPGKDFVCIEPFTGPNDTINTDRRIDIPPGKAHTFWMKIELD